MSKYPDITITVLSGIVEVTAIKEGLTFKIIDYDVEGYPEESLSEDESGESCYITTNITTNRIY